MGRRPLRRLLSIAISATDGHAAAYPGLDGSRVWHGDSNANGDFDFGDINAFVDLVMGEICGPEGIPDDEGDEESEESEESVRSAADVAEFLSTYVSASRQQALLEIVAGAADYYAEDAERGALWDDVYDLLSE